MSDVELRGRALADRAAAEADLAASEIHEFGSWLLDVMSRLIVVQDKSDAKTDLRSLARQAYYQHVLSVPEQRCLGRWVAEDLATLRHWDRRATDRNPREKRPSGLRVGGSRAADLADDVARAVQLRDLDGYFGISDSLIERGCSHGFRPAKTCPDAACEARRANIAWDAFGPAAVAAA